MFQLAPARSTIGVLLTRSTTLFLLLLLALVRAAAAVESILAVVILGAAVVVIIALSFPAIVIFTTITILAALIIVLLIAIPIIATVLIIITVSVTITLRLVLALNTLIVLTTVAQTFFIAVALLTIGTLPDASMHRGIAPPVRFAVLAGVTTQGSTIVAKGSKKVGLIESVDEYIRRQGKNAKEGAQEQTILHWGDFFKNKRREESSFSFIFVCSCLPSFFLTHNKQHNNSLIVFAPKRICKSKCEVGSCPWHSIFEILKSV